MAMQTAGMIIIPIVPLATKIDCKYPGEVMPRLSTFYMLEI